MFHAKTEVLKAFLAFVASYVPLRDASLATLGGEGREAALWLDAGIRPESGWLIECKVARNRRLMARYPYRNMTRLASFHRATESVRGVRYGIDGFHLDLCGTYERSDAAFRPAIPVLLRSKGKCLAVTVADQRRNTSLEQFDEVSKRGQSLFGPRARAFLDELKTAYRALPSHGIGLSADAALGGRREFALALRLLSALDKARFRIDRIERYLYVSRNGGKPFRMRTYFLHFGDRPQAEDVTQLWTSAPIKVVTEEGFIPVKLRKEKEESMETSYPNLQKLAETVGGQHLEEFRALVLDADYGRRVYAIPYGNGRGKPEAAAEPENKLAAKLNGSKAGQMLKLLRAEFIGAVELRKAETEVAKDLGFRGKAKQRKIGGFRARAKGKFRQQFIGLLKEEGLLDDAVLSELAGIYSKLEGRTVTVEDLQVE